MKKYVLYTGKLRIFANSIEELKLEVVRNLRRIRFFENKAMAIVVQLEPYARFETYILKRGNELRFADADETAAFGREFKARLDAVLNSAVF